MQQSKLIVPTRRLVIPHMRVRERLAPAPRLGARLEAHHLLWQVINPNGSIAQEAEQHNLILNQAGDLIQPVTSLAALAAYAVVGTGSTAPAATDTQLVSESVRTNSDPTGNSGQVRTSDGVYVYTSVKQFDAATVASLNLAEWGFSPGATSGANLISRELFRDGSNNPVTITPDGTQKLRLIYAIQLTLTPVVATDFTSWVLSDYPDAGQNLTITGKTCLTRSGYTGYSNIDIDTFFAFVSGAIDTKHPALAYFDGTSQFTPTYGTPNDNVGSLGQISLDAYTAGSNTRTGSYTINDTAANGSINGLKIGTKIGSSPVIPGVYMAFDTAAIITKNSLHKLSLSGFGWSWTVG